MIMNKSLELAVAFNIETFEKNGEVSVRADRIEFYRGLLNPRRIKKFVHKTLGKGYTLYK